MGVVMLLFCSTIFPYSMFHDDFPYSIFTIFRRHLPYQLRWCDRNDFHDFWLTTIWRKIFFLDNAVCGATRGNLCLAEPSAIWQNRTQPSWHRYTVYLTTHWCSMLLLPLVHHYIKFWFLTSWNFDNFHKVHLTWLGSYLTRPSLFRMRCFEGGAQFYYITTMAFEVCRCHFGPRQGGVTKS